MPDMPVLALEWARIARAAAATAYVALALSVCLGLLQSIARRRAAARAASLLADAHQFVTLLAALLVVLHLAALALNPLLTFPAVALLLPLGDPQRPVAHALGALGLYTMALVLLTSWLRRRLPPRLWRRLHGASFAVFALSSVHGLLAGSDTGALWMHVIYIGAVGMVTLLALVRLALRGSSRDVARRRDAPASAPVTARLRT